MRTLEILIEQAVPGDVRPMELAAYAPVSALLPAIVDELRLPRTDLLGNPLVYVLRYAPTGPILPNDKSLVAAGIHSGTKLALDSYVFDGSVAALKQTRQRAQQPTVSASMQNYQRAHQTGYDVSVQNFQGSRQPTFYASDTLADSAAFPALDMHTSGSLYAMPRKKEKHWSRRAFLLLGGAAVVGAGAVGVGYAANHHLLSFLNTSQTPPAKTAPAPLKTPTRVNATSTAQPFAPPTTARKALVFTQHQQTVRSVAWSPNGKMLASGANDKLLLTWDLNGTVQGQQQQGGIVHTVAWSPDGLWLAAGSTNHVALFNVVNGLTQQQVLDGHNKTVTTLAWSSQQPLRLLSGSSDMHAIVWNIPAFTQQTDFTRHTAAILSSTWASDGQTVATSSEGGVIRVWNAGSGQEVHGYYLDAQLPMRALAFAPTGSLLAVGGDDGIVRLWSGLTCQQGQQSAFGNQCMDTPQRLHAHNGIIRALAWSLDGRLLATGGDDGTLAIWYPTQSQTPLLRVHLDGPVLSLAWSLDGKQVATASGNNVTLWNLH
ncbi:MAG: hypothetical protein ACRDIV_02455 [Ktedonobacteraceae bacterium]